MLEWTGERYLPFVDPSVCGAGIHYEHLHRYAFASRFVHGKKVLDLASGEGYGTCILAEKAAHVVGVEIDSSTVAHAKSTYTRSNIEFRTGSILDIPVEGEKVFDVIICFEAMEHVKEQDTLFSEIKRLLKDEGLLLVSTPNKEIYTDDSGYCNPFHQKELRYDEFSDFLNKYFSRTFIFGQRTLSGSLIYPASVGSSGTCSEFFIERLHDRFSFTGETEKKPSYFIALASDTEISRKNIQNSYLVDRSNTEITLLHNQISQDITKMLSLQEEIMTRDNRLIKISANIDTLHQTLAAQHQDLASKDQQLRDLSSQVQSLNHALTDKDTQIQKITSQVQSLRDENDAMKRSVSYKMVTKFHRSVIERLFPHQTRRRNTYETGLKGIRILVNDGWENFYWQFREKVFHKPIVRKRVYFPQEKITPVPKPESTTIIETCVSVIIPTKNAGPDFARVLEKITCQKGIRDIEIIVIDSGSSDETLDTARKFGSRIYQISPEEFNHGTTRNYGAEKARGTYLCFLVQDAIPAGDFWLYSMVKVLEGNPLIAAATCRQIPRSDADLFACFGLWQHYFYTLAADSDRICHTDADFETPPGEEKRRLAGLDDVSCLIRKEIFEKFRFRKIQSSEDLDLGKRFIREGYRNAFLFSVGVIHSHNRSPDYFLRRSYVDTKTVADIIGYQTQEVSKDCTLTGILGAVISLYTSLNRTVDSIDRASFALPIRELSARIRSDIVNNYNHAREERPELGNKGRHLDSALLAIMHRIAGQPDNSNKAQNTLIFLQYEWVLNNFFEYLEIYGTLEGKEEEFLESLSKIFAVIAGASLASYYLHAVSAGRVDNEISAIDAYLCEGV